MAKPNKFVSYLWLPSLLVQMIAMIEEIHFARDQTKIQFCLILVVNMVEPPLLEYMGLLKLDVWQIMWHQLAV